MDIHSGFRTAKEVDSSLRKIDFSVARPGERLVGSWGSREYELISTYIPVPVQIGNAARGVAKFASGAM